MEKPSLRGIRACARGPFRGRNRRTLRQVSLKVGKDGFQDASRVYPFEAWEKPRCPGNQKESGDEQANQV